MTDIAFGQRRPVLGWIADRLALSEVSVCAAANGANHLIQLPINPTYWACRTREHFSRNGAFNGNENVVDCKFTRWCFLCKKTVSN